MVLKKLTLENFKSHKKTTIDFGKVTVLIGHNNAGKSSILQSLIMLSQSVKTGQNVLSTKNDVLDLGEYSDIVNSRNISKPLTINLEFSEKILLGENVADWICRADQQLYHAKRSGRNQVCAQSFTSLLNSLIN